MNLSVTLCSACLTLGAQASYAQTGGSNLSFEAATVKVSSDGHGMSIGRRGGPGTPDPGRVTFENFPLRGLVDIAYDLKLYQYSGPDWTESAHFDVKATLPPGATKEQFQVMLQNLLKERFGLAVHREKREMPVYALVALKSGAKLKRLAPGTEAPADDANSPGGRRPAPKDAEGFPIIKQRGTLSIGGNRARLRGQTIDFLLRQLSGQTHRPVLDETGLTGDFDFTLSWAPNPDAPNAVGIPDLYTALQQQLGLRLESKKGPVEILVVDHAEKTPAGN